jgi:hypothetical protein
MKKAIHTKNYRERVKPSDEQIEQWEREYEDRRNSPHSDDFDYEGAILAEQEADESWWG